MGYRIWFYLLLLNFTTSVLIQAISREESRAVKRLLDHIVYEGYDSYQIKDCNDPCTLDKRFVDPKYVEATRKEILQCSAIPVSCTSRERNSKYPTVDGRCNNLRHPDWGMSDTCHRRILPPDYANGKSYPRKSCLGVELPNARVVSNVLHQETPRNRNVRDNEHTIHFMEWGQVIAHDLSWAIPTNLPERGNGSCCDPYPRIDDDCIAVPVPPDDTFFPGKRDCLSFQRTLACPSCKRVRHSKNSATSFHDLSLVYGTSENQSRSLRSGQNGTLLTQEIPGVGCLPPGVKKNSKCESINSTHLCFTAGDPRINQNLLLTSLHIILLRNHNKLCRKLQSVNPHWNDEMLFQEARKLIIAQAQYITYRYYLRNSLGPKVTAEFDLDALPGTSYTTYDPAWDPSIGDEFTTAVLRYGHTMVPNKFIEQNPTTKEFDVVFLRDYFWWPFDYYSGQLDRLTLGMTEISPNKHSLHLGTDVRDFLYHRRQEKLFEGSDLAAISIVRGRDHGIPGYTYYLKYLFDYEVRSFCDLKKFIPTDSILKMKQVYGSVHDIDLYTAGLAERHIEGAVVGPTFAAILALQFKGQKFGNRYYFEHKGQAGSFTPRQLAEIKKTTYSRLLCETTMIEKVQEDAFLPISDRNREIPCNSFPKLNLAPWKERRSSAAHARRFKNNKSLRTLF